LKAFFRILFALLAIRLVLMAIVPVFEPSEARYAAIAANMARTGDFVVPRFTYKCEYQSFDGKPPLVFQAGGVCCRLLGTGNRHSLQLAVRIFPLLSAMLLLAILFHAVRITADVRRAWLAVAICATCTAFYAAAGMALTDMSLTCCTAGALLLYECCLEARRRREGRAELAYMAGVAALLGAGMMVKGPVSLAMFGLPVLADAAVNRRWGGVFNWKWLAVAPIYFAIAVPWFVLVEQRNPGSVWYFFYNENFMRFVSHDYGDKYGAGRETFRGVSVLWAIVATLPWALIPLWKAVTLVRRGTWRAVGGAFRRFDVLAVLSIVGFWCLTSRVLLYYLFPMIPLFAAALARTGDERQLERAVPWAAGVSAAVVGFALVGGMLFSDKMAGAKTPFEPWTNHYAHEFYHGTKPAAELEKYRTAMEVWRANRGER